MQSTANTLTRLTITIPSPSFSPGLPGSLSGILKVRSPLSTVAIFALIHFSGKEYLDFLSAYGAVNQGHCHPELVKALTEQASRLTLSSRAFYNDVFPRFAEFVTAFFGFDMVLPMNTGAEAVETAVKIARKWGYKAKGIPQNEALVLSVTENFHGRTVCESKHDEPLRADC